MQNFSGLTAHMVISVVEYYTDRTTSVEEILVEYHFLFNLATFCRHMTQKMSPHSFSYKHNNMKVFKEGP